MTFTEVFAVLPSLMEVATHVYIPAMSLVILMISRLLSLLIISPLEETQCTGGVAAEFDGSQSR